MYIYTHVHMFFCVCSCMCVRERIYIDMFRYICIQISIDVLNEQAYPTTRIRDYVLSY